ncbi:MAG: RsmB/NOP family class I SAM-dependent RNA methyltransferase [Verrucomicrobia bacterium]|nr:RsmB/NOP family class I SAM-dependent RNA methyltransferase [Verrucomicrobiota bacterium]
MKRASRPSYPARSRPAPTRTPRTRHRPAAPTPPSPAAATPQPDNRVAELATRVLAQASRSHPADAVLRDELRKQRGLPRALAASVTRAVFACYRWFGWLDPRQTLSQQVPRALELEARFASDPHSFSDAELLACTVPSWVHAFVSLTPAWVRSLQQAPVLWLRARPGQGHLLARQLGDVQPAGPGPWADALRYDGAQDLFRTPQFQAGHFELQDLHSQAVGWVAQPQPGQTWWDACAGEGGKTLHLSALMQNRGLIWATDRAAWRLRRLRLRAARAQVFNYRVAPWDGRLPLPSRTAFDGVLVDAPCSNLGTWQRNPHARWTTVPEDIRELADLQRQLLLNAAPAVRPGGRLIYAVCTLTPSETTDLATEFTQARPDFVPVNLPDPFASTAPPSRPQSQLAPQPLSGPWLWLRPEARPANGMFIAAWQRQR